MGSQTFQKMYCPDFGCNRFCYILMNCFCALLHYSNFFLISNSIPLYPGTFGKYTIRSYGKKTLRFVISFEQLGIHLSLSIHPLFLWTILHVLNLSLTLLKLILEHSGLSQHIQTKIVQPIKVQLPPLPLSCCHKCAHMIGVYIVDKMNTNNTCKLSVLEI